MRTDEVKTVLLVEGNPADVRLAREAFSTFDDVRLLVAPDGDEAVEFLNKEGNHANAPRPDLVLLDFNLAEIDGQMVLAHIKTHEELKTIPTVVLTSAILDKKVADQAERLMANSVLKKPNFFGQFQVLVKAIHRIWLRDRRL